MAITLLTDFGDRDTYVGQMKGVLAAMAPGVPVIDLTHRIRPQNILEAAIQLDTAVDAFADDTIHVAVVDPGVGTARRAVAVRCACGTLVGPDNGVFTAVLDRYPVKAAVSIEDQAYLRHPIRPTFHGRDIFAPAAAHLATGLHLTELGPALDPPLRPLVRLDLPHPLIDRESRSITAHVLLADRFGNLVTDLRREAFDVWLGGGEPGSARVEVGRSAPLPIAHTFGDVGHDEPLAYFGSSGRLEIAVRNGDAQQALNLRPGDTVRVAIGS